MNTETAFNSRSLPTQITSEKKMAPDVPGAIKVLKKFDALDVAEVLGLKEEG